MKHPLSVRPEAKSPPTGAPRWIVVVIFAAVGLSIGFNYLVKATQPVQDIAQEIPIRSSVTADLELTERSGQTIRLSSLKGKVTAMAYIYTVCPHGCAAVVGEMKKLLEKYRDRPDFQLVSIAILPDHDNAGFLKSYAEGLGLTPADPWWFLTGERAKIWDFMDHQLRLTPAVAIPENERLNPLDTYEHDLRIVLLDRDRNVRGYYSVFHPQPEIASLMSEKLEKDIATLLGP